MDKLERLNYLVNTKRQQVLDNIKPICKAFGIEKYDYEINNDTLSETLVLNGTRIGCSCNSISATIEEVIGYIFIRVYCENRYWYHKPQTEKAIKKY